MDIRKVMEIDIEEDKETFQLKVESALRKVYNERIELYRICNIVANQYGIPGKELYQRAKECNDSTELIDLLPQIPKNLPVEVALRQILDAVENHAWVLLDENNAPETISLTEPPGNIKSVPIKVKSYEVSQEVSKAAS